MKNLKYLNGFYALFVLAAVAVSVQPASADELRVLTIKGKPFGESYRDWVVDFTRWVYSLPAEKNPFVQGNLNCTQPQHGKVWFVGTASKEKPASCEVPKGKALFMTLGSYADTYPCPDPNFAPAPGQTLAEFLVADAKNFVDANVVGNTLTIDGYPVITDVSKYRVSSGLFSLTGDPSLTASLDSCVTGQRQKAVVDGYWAMIVGLKTGRHRFEFYDGTIMNIRVVDDRD